MTTCERCGQPYGRCNIDAHLQLLQDESAFDLTQRVKTAHYATSISPRLSEPYFDGQQTVADVAAVVSSKGPTLGHRGSRAAL